MKINIGGKEKKEGWKILNIQDGEHVDFHGDISDLSQFENGSVEEIYCSHALEYFDYSDCQKVITDWKRCLFDDGKLRISVPDFDKLLKVYKASDGNIDKIIGPLFGRWEINNSEKIYHRCVFNKQKLRNIIYDCGFKSITEWDPLKYFGAKKTDYDDYSKAYFPHMDFKNGFSISINFLASK